MNNFSMSQTWNNSLLLRYPYDLIIKIGNLYYYLDDDILKCQHFFDLNNYDLDELKKYLDDNKKIRFSYINDSNFLNDLIKWSTKNNCFVEYIDTWDAPMLEIKTDIKEYFRNNSHSQIKRNYKKYENQKNDYIIKNSYNNDILSLWNDVLIIDFNSWKKEEKSDMKSLNREDLQYLPFLLENRDDSNLEVLYDKDNKPLAYSLMFKSNDLWYQVKWGASFDGRKKGLGFFVLFDHLIYLYNLKKELHLDFWGRRNNTYDYLKNKSIKRNHILIYKKEN